jgi:hypothetical protein
MFHQQGKCCANLHTDDLDVAAPAELINLDYGKMPVGRTVQKMRHGAFSRSKNKGYLDAAIAKSNEFWPSRMYIAPYGASTGNMWAENYTMTQYQTGGRQTSLAGRSGMLKMQPLVARKMDRRQIERSQYQLDETTFIGDRFVPPLKPVCKRDFGPGARSARARAQSHAVNTRDPEFLLMLSILAIRSPSMALDLPLTTSFASPPAPFSAPLFSPTVLPQIHTKLAAATCGTFDPLGLGETPRSGRQTR